MALIKSWNYIKDSMGYPCSNHECYDNDNYCLRCEEKCQYHYDIEWIDAVGGYHSNRKGINPQGYLCDKCNKESCENCEDRDLI